MSSNDALRGYLSACDREGVVPIKEFSSALEKNDKVAQLQSHKPPLEDKDLRCIATAIRRLGLDSPLKVLSLEDNRFGRDGVVAIMDAIEAAPSRIRELRLGKNNLKDDGAGAIAPYLSRSRCGLKVLDLSENGLTKSGVGALASSLQSPHCEIVELSFHNNKLEADAGEVLATIVLRSTSLKHLHLGYNTLSDDGVIALCKGLSQGHQLATLDLTANRIGPSGARALTDSLCELRCGIQRLNLRHNLLNSESIERFEKVIRNNQSLIQLFLGFMSPNAESAEKVLHAVAENRSLLLLDICNWKLNPKGALEAIQTIQERNSTFAALVTDACQSIEPQINEGNNKRSERGTHPIYVGPDDRDAYMATKSLKRFCRAQSRNSSRQRSQSARSRQASVHRVRKSSHQENSEVGSTASSTRRRRMTPKHREDGGERAMHELNRRSPTSNDVGSEPARSRKTVHTEADDEEIKRLLRELRTESKMDAESKRIVEGITEELLKMIRKVQNEKACCCGQHVRHGHQEHSNRNTSNFSPSQKTGLYGSYSEPHRGEAGSSNTTGDQWQANRTRSESAPPRVPPSQRSASQNRFGNYVREREKTPMAHLSEKRDAPPSVAHVPDVGGDHRPRETSLQRSASVANFPPPLESSPSRDLNPPRRKPLPSSLIY